MDSRSMLLEDNNADWFADLVPSPDGTITTARRPRLDARPGPGRRTPPLNVSALAPRGSDTTAERSVAAPGELDSARWSLPTEIEAQRSTSVEAAPASSRDDRRAGRAVSDRWGQIRDSADRHRRAVLVTACAATTVLAVGAVLAFTVGDSGSGASTTSAAPAAPATVGPPVSPTAAPSQWCSGEAAGAPVHASDTDPGTAAIARFEDAYYLDRDAGEARKAVAPDATTVGTVEQIASGIAQIPTGTEHCVLAAPTAQGSYAVDIFERRPDGTERHYKQLITTAPAPAPGIGSVLTTIATRGDL